MYILFKKYGGQRDSTAGRELALHTAHLGLIFDIPYGPSAPPGLDPQNNKEKK